MRTRLLSVLSFVVLFFLSSYAQDYNSAIGLRFGYPSSVSYKKFVSDHGAFEGVVGFRSYSGFSSINIGAYYQYHNDIGTIPNFRWYYGGGANIYFWNTRNTFIKNNSSTSLGISGVIGLDYKFEEIPINVSIDWMPTVLFAGYEKGFGANGGLAVRYTIN